MARPADPHRREAILRAARAVFLENGYARTRMADIAARAGVAPGTLYLYFKSKESLILALVDEHFDRLAALVIPRLNHPDSRVAIPEAVRATFAYIADEQDFIRLLRLDLDMSRSESHQLPAARVRFHQALAKALRVGMEEGHLHWYDPQILSELLSGLIEWTVEACLVRGDGDLARYEETLTDLLLRAMFRDPHGVSQGMAQRGQRRGMPQYESTQASG